MPTRRFRPFGRRAMTCCALLLCIAWRADGDDWKLIGAQHGIEIYRRDVPGSSLVAFRGEGEIDAPVWKVASVLLDTRRAPEWADSLVESRVVKRLAPDAYVEYNHIGMPFILKDREFVSDVTIQIDAEARIFALIYKPSGARVPATHYVRGEIRSGIFQVRSLEQGRRSVLTAEVQCDPKGAIPAWVVNFFQKGWPIKTFEGVRAQAAKPDVVMPDEFKSVLAPILPF
jgi:hypothetical protein